MSVPSQVIVVGGGLAGLSAAHTVLEHGGNVLVIEKNPFLGGNSTKATSGINGALTRTQVRLGIKDSVESFYDDTFKSAKDLARAPLIQVLTGNSGPAVEWLQGKFGLDLSLVSRLGGHSFPRTHRGKEKFPGMTITYALMEKLEELTRSQPDRVKVVTKARVTKLVQDSQGQVIGVEFEREGKVGVEYGPVVLATGGYAADFANDGLIKKYRPDIFDLPTTNGDWSTGDGLKMASFIGGNTIDMEKVQVHPTGLVDPNEPDAKVKFLAAEALRGCGGIMVNNEGDRFCDELGTRDYVTGEMWKNKRAPYRLILNKAAGKEIEWHCKHYIGRGLMKKFDNFAALAKEMNVPLSKLEDTIKKYNEYSKNGKDPWNKKYFHNVPINTNEELYVSIVTPVVHYCMGGLEINADSEILGKNGPIKGLFGAGEVAGGVHGANRLGGSSLLGCVVYGRVAGDTAARYLMRQLVSRASEIDPAARRLGALSQQITVSSGDLHFTVDPTQQKLSISWNGVPTAHSQAAPVAQVPAVKPQAQQQAKQEAPKTSELKEYTVDEVAKHNTEKDCWVIVNGQVLDVTDFLKEHPGGKKAILIFAGKDATEEFNMLHKPDVVEKYAPTSIIGKVKGASGHAKAKL